MRQGRLELPREAVEVRCRFGWLVVRWLLADGRARLTMLCKDWLTVLAVLRTDLEHLELRVRVGRSATSPGGRE